MTVCYHIGECPFCRQGNLYLFRNLSTGDVYGHCEECEYGYLSPDALETPHGGFLTLLDDDEAEPATAEEIARSVWANYPVRTVEI